MQASVGEKTVPIKESTPICKWYLDLPLSWCPGNVPYFSPVLDLVSLSFPTLAKEIFHYSLSTHSRLLLEACMYESGVTQTSVK